MNHHNVLIVGATSTLAIHVARRLVSDQTAFFLVGRNAEELADVAQDLSARGARKVDTLVQDANRFEDHQVCIDTAHRELGGFDLAMICYGSLPSQEASQGSVSTVLEEIAVNGTTVVSYATMIANVLEQQNAGCLAVFSSVAGERGRRSNYIYGSAKSLVTTYLQGLRHRFSATPVRIVTILPGMVDTKMTEDMPKGPLFSAPETVAEDIVRALGSNRDVVYTPWFWRYIMMIIRSLPWPIFKRLNV